MDRLIKEQLESLFHDTSPSKRLGRRILNLAGFLSPSDPPEHISEQLNRLSRLLVQQDTFDALLEPISMMARSAGSGSNMGTIQAMLASLEAARNKIEAMEDINFAQLITWLVELAQSRKIIKIKPIDITA